MRPQQGDRHPKSAAIMPTITGEDFRPTALLSPGGSQPPPSPQNHQQGARTSPQNHQQRARTLPEAPPRRCERHRPSPSLAAMATPTSTSAERGRPTLAGRATRRVVATRTEPSRPAGRRSAASGAATPLQPPLAAGQQADRKPKGRRQTAAAPQSTTMASNAAAWPQVAAGTKEVACTVQTPDPGETSPDPG
jgi:hypothetical protein